MTNVGGDERPKTSTSPVSTPLPPNKPPTQYKGCYDCKEPADWDQYLTQGWKCVLWNNDPEGWAKYLEQAGCGQAKLGGPEFGNLNNDIHPIFARKNWVQGIDDSLWEILSPALRLASKLLLSKIALAFFRQVLFGVECQAGKRTYLHYVAPENTQDQEEEARSCLDALGAKLHLLFAATPAKHSDGQIHALHCVSHRHFGQDYYLRGNLERLPEDNGKSHFLLINQAYAEYFTEYTWKQQTLESSSPCDFVRTTFSLASALVHEIGHAFYVRDRIDGDEDYLEPYFDLTQHDMTGELGCALEFLIFGVQINPAVHPQYGAQLEWHPVVKEVIGDCIEVIDTNHLIFPMNPTWMYSLMTQEFWNLLESKPVDSQLHGLFVPKAVNFGATLHPRTKKWAWRTRKAELTRFGTRVNEVALAEKVGERKRQNQEKARAMLPLLSAATQLF
jgi:hypothetical protein